MLTDKVDDELLDTAGKSCEPFHEFSSDVFPYIFNWISVSYYFTIGQQLKVVSTMSVGYDHVDMGAIKKRKLPLGYTPDVLTDATADLTALLTLAAARRIKEVSNYT
jgi:phosphoglycerate dehydrogenase-like enzyme